MKNGGKSEKLEKLFRGDDVLEINKEWFCLIS